MTIRRTGAVDVVHWNPRVPILPGPLQVVNVPWRRRTNNFGDLLGPEIVARMLASHKVEPTRPGRRPERRLLAVGSILHFAKNDDVIWGTGINGKEPVDQLRFSRLDVRATRGPLTARVLRSRGIETPDVYGDPGLLVPILFPEVAKWRDHLEHSITVVPNLHDFPRLSRLPEVLDPTSSLIDCIERIARSERVVSSSLHGIVIAESLGIPASILAPKEEPPFKYEDYYTGTGRELPDYHHSVDDAAKHPAPPIEAWSSRALTEAFPIDIWREALVHSGS